jgi:hypothetical protein
MTKTHGTLIVVFLAILTVIAFHRAYLQKHTPPKYEYTATESAKIDLAALRSAGEDGWDCNITPVTEPLRYVVICKRFQP